MDIEAQQIRLMHFLHISLLPYTKFDTNPRYFHRNSKIFRKCDVTLKNFANLPKIREIAKFNSREDLFP